MLADYAYMDVTLVHPEFTTTEATEVALFAMWTLGTPYGWLTIAGCVWDLLTGFKLFDRLGAADDLFRGRVPGPGARWHLHA